MTSTTRIACLTAFALAACNRDALPGPTPDLAITSDLGASVDFATLPDLAQPVDFTIPLDLAPNCSGMLGICAVNGHWEKTDGRGRAGTGMICSTDPGGSESPVKAETCNGLDDNCDGFVDENCPESCDLVPICLAEVSVNQMMHKIHWDATAKGVMNAWVVCADDSSTFSNQLGLVGMSGDFTISVNSGVFRCQMLGDSFNTKLHSNIITLKN